MDFMFFFKFNFDVQHQAFREITLGQFSKSFQKGFFITESLREIQSQLNGIKEHMKTHKEDIDKAKSVLETQNKSMVQSLENLQNQMEHMENNMTKMMEKVKEVETQIKTVENDATETKEKVQKWKYK